MVCEALPAALALVSKLSASTATPQRAQPRPLPPEHQEQRGRSSASQEGRESSVSPRPSPRCASGGGTTNTAASVEPPTRKPTRPRILSEDSVFKDTPSRAWRHAEGADNVAASGGIGVTAAESSAASGAAKHKHAEAEPAGLPPCPPDSPSSRRRRAEQGGASAAVRDYWISEVESALANADAVELSWALQFADGAGVESARLARARRRFPKLAEARLARDTAFSLSSATGSSATSPGGLTPHGSAPLQRPLCEASAEAFRLAEAAGLARGRLAEARLQSAEGDGDPHRIAQELLLASEAGVSESRLEQARGLAVTLRALHSAALQEALTRRARRSMEHADVLGLSYGTSSSTRSLRTLGRPPSSSVLYSVHSDAESPAERRTLTRNAQA